MLWLVFFCPHVCDSHFWGAFKTKKVAVQAHQRFVRIPTKDHPRNPSLKKASSSSPPILMQMCMSIYHSISSDILILPTGPSWPL